MATTAAEEEMAQETVNSENGMTGPEVKSSRKAHENEAGGEVQRKRPRKRRWQLKWNPRLGFRFQLNWMMGSS